MKGYLSNKKIYLAWIKGWDPLSSQLTYRGLLTEGIQQTCEHQLWMRRKNPHHLQEQSNIVRWLNVGSSGEVQHKKPSADQQSPSLIISGTVLRHLQGSGNFFSAFS